MAESLRLVRRELADLTISPPPGLSSAELSRRRAAAVSQEAATEDAIAQALGELPERLPAIRTDNGMLGEVLPSRSVLLDYVCFDEFDFTTKNRAVKTRERCYVVFVTSTDDKSQLIMVDLGSAKPIDDAIAAFHSSLGKLDKGLSLAEDGEVRERLMVVRRLVLNPVLPAIAQDFRTPAGAR